MNFFDENDRGAVPRQVCLLSEDISIKVSVAGDGKKQYTTSLSQLIPAAVQNDSPIKGDFIEICNFTEFNLLSSVRGSPLSPKHPW